MDLQLGLALPSNPQELLASVPCNHDKKRSFSQLSEHNTDVLLLPTLPLLPLTPDDYHSSCSAITKNNGDDAEGAVGWPPIISQRKKLRYGVEAAGNDDEDHGSVDLIRGYVKVKMEGVRIARKVDLSLHHSFQKLKETLIGMFGKCHQHSNCYELAYQDKQGDWLLAEDVPWRSFIECAKRLKLLKSRG